MEMLIISSYLLNTMVAEAEAQIQDVLSNLDAADLELKALLETSENRKREFGRLLSWVDLCGKSSFAAKRMIVSQFIKSVRIGSDYNIEVNFNVSFDEFQSFCGVKSKGSVKAEAAALVRSA